MNQAADVIDYLAIEMAQAGDPIAPPRAYCLAYLVQAFALNILGRPAFPQRLIPGKWAPRIEGISRNETFMNPEVNPNTRNYNGQVTGHAYELTPDVVAVADLVLEEFANVSAYELARQIKACPAYAAAQSEMRASISGTAFGAQHEPMRAAWSGRIPERAEKLKTLYTSR